MGHIQDDEDVGHAFTSSYENVRNQQMLETGLKSIPDAENIRWLRWPTGNVDEANQQRSQRRQTDGDNQAKVNPRNNPTRSDDYAAGDGRNDDRHALED